MQHTVGSVNDGSKGNKCERSGGAETSKGIRSVRGPFCHVVDSASSLLAPPPHHNHGNICIRYAYDELRAEVRNLPGMPSSKKTRRKKKAGGRPKIRKDQAESFRDRLSKIASMPPIFDHRLKEGMPPPLDPVDESTITDPISLSFLSLRDEAKNQNLFELEMFLTEIVLVIVSGSNEHLERLYEMFRREGIFTSQCDRSLNKKTMLWGLELFRNEVSEAMELFRDSKVADSVSRNEQTTRSVVELLASKSLFDYGHEMHRIQQVVMEVSGDESDRKMREFHAEKPLDKYQRADEPGFAAATKQAQYVTCAHEANELGKNAFRAKCLWTAELFWNKAAELGTEAKYWSNLAFIRIQLGRYVPSLGIGYRQSSTQLLEAAIMDAAKGIDVDPLWERAYQRKAEAHLAIGPYDHAMDACRILKQAVEAVEKPSNALLELYEKANHNARLWCTLMFRPDATIPQCVHSSLMNLRSRLVRCLPATLSDEELRTSGDEIVNAITIVRGVLQLIYLRRDQWRMHSTQPAASLIDIQIELRQVAKVLPLRAIYLSQSLK